MNQENVDEIICALVIAKGNIEAATAFLAGRGQSVEPAQKAVWNAERSFKRRKLPLDLLRQVSGDNSD